MKNPLRLFILYLIITSCNQSPEDINDSFTDTVTNRIILFQDDFNSIGNWKFNGDSTTYAEDTSNAKIENGVLDLVHMKNPNFRIRDIVFAWNDSTGIETATQDINNLGLKIILKHGSFYDIYVIDEQNGDRYRESSISALYKDFCINLPISNLYHNEIIDTPRVINGKIFDIWISYDSAKVRIDNTIVYEGQYLKNDFAYNSTSNISRIKVLVGNKNKHDYTIKDSLAIDYLEIYTLEKVKNGW